MRTAAPCGARRQKTVTAPASPAEARPKPIHGAFSTAAVAAMIGTSSQSMVTTSRSANRR